jgi:hypothetical protein
MAKTVGKLPLYLNPEFPQELLQRRYSVTRDEMMWRQYDSSKRLDGPEATRNALRILRVIRESPD